jgi:hypothetical protein
MKERHSASSIQHSAVWRQVPLWLSGPGLPLLDADYWMLDAVSQGPSLDDALPPN